MATEFQGKIKLDIRDSEPDWTPYAAPVAPAGAPNVLYLVWDDTGIATWDCFGGLVDMPGEDHHAGHDPVVRRVGGILGPAPGRVVDPGQTGGAQRRGQVS